jgi:hypothetical protein
VSKRPSWGPRGPGPEHHECPAEAILGELQELRQSLTDLHRKADQIMSQQQEDVNAAAAFDTQLDADLQALTGQVTAGQQALDTAIANLNAKIAAGQQVDTTELVAAQAVLAGDQPNLDAAVAALGADPNAAPPAP